MRSSTNPDAISGRVTAARTYWSMGGVSGYDAVLIAEARYPNSGWRPLVMSHSVLGKSDYYVVGNRIVYSLTRIK